MVAGKVVNVNNSMQIVDNTGGAGQRPEAGYQRQGLPHAGQQQEPAGDRHRDPGRVLCHPGHPCPGQREGSLRLHAPAEKRPKRVQGRLLPHNGGDAQGTEQSGSGRVPADYGAELFQGGKGDGEAAAAGPVEITPTRKSTQRHCLPSCQVVSENLCNQEFKKRGKKARGFLHKNFLNWTKQCVLDRNPMESILKCLYGLK